MHMTPVELRFSLHRGVHTQHQTQSRAPSPRALPLSASAPGGHTLRSRSLLSLVRAHGLLVWHTMRMLSPWPRPHRALLTIASLLPRARASAPIASSRSARAPQSSAASVYFYPASVGHKAPSQACLSSRAVLLASASADGDEARLDRRDGATRATVVALLAGEHNRGVVNDPQEERWG